MLPHFMRVIVGKLRPRRSTGVGMIRAVVDFGEQRRGFLRFAGAGLASILSYQVEQDLTKPESTLHLENMGEEWSHKFLLQQSSVLNVESASVTLTQTVVAIQTCSRSYCTHLTQLTSLLTIASDGLPIAYTNEEVYEKVVQLRAIIKKEKATLLELGVLFSYIKKLMDSVAETAFLVGAEYASLQAASRLCSAELQIKQELSTAERAEQDLLAVEKENVLKVGKEEKSVSKIDMEFVKEEVKKFDKMEKVDISDSQESKLTEVDISDFQEIKRTEKENDVINDDKLGVSEERYSLLGNSDDEIKISVHENITNDDIIISVKDDEQDVLPKEEKVVFPEMSQYKMPTF